MLQTSHCHLARAGHVLPVSRDRARAATPTPRDLYANDLININQNESHRLVLFMVLVSHDVEIEIVGLSFNRHCQFRN